MAAIFISHSSKDKSLADEIAGRLKKRDFVSFFLDFDPALGIPPGRNWERELYHRLLSCKAVLFICSEDSVASKWCFAELTHARALNKPVLPIRVSGCPLPDILRDSQAVDLAAEQETAYQRLWAELERIGISEEDGFAWDGTRPPYPGIFSFDERDAAIFFGRREDTRQLVSTIERLRFSETRLALVIGASGSGKSSLVRAGLLPRLRPKRGEWLVFDPIIAGPGLIETLSEKLASALKHAGIRKSYNVIHRTIVKAASGSAALEGSDFSGLLRSLRGGDISTDAHLLWVIDQAERLMGGDEATKLGLQLIGKCARAAGLPLQMLLTMRSDHLDAFQGSAPLDGCRFESFPIGPLSSASFGEVIEGPARLVGLGLGPGLVPNMVVDANRRDGLPLLAFALRELWDKFGKSNGKLSLEDYQEKLGRLEGCVAKRAKEIMAELALSDDDRRALGQTLCRMARISEGDVFLAQPVAWNSVPERVKPALQRFVDARLLVSGREPGKVEVAHDVLFDAWDDLREWLKVELSFFRWQRDLQSLLREWQEHEQDTAQVHLSGALLLEAERWLASRRESLNPAEQSFIEASLQRAQREQERWQRAYQESLSRQLAAQAQVLFAYEAAELTERGLLLAVEAMRRCTELGISSFEADQALRQGLSLAARRTAEITANRPVDFQAVSVHPGKPIVALGQNDGRVWFWNLNSGKCDEGPLLTSAIQHLAYSPDGRWLAVSSELGECRIINSENGASRSLDQEDRVPATAVAFSRDGNYAAIAFNTRIMVCETATESEPVIIECPQRYTAVISMTFSGDGAVLVTQGLMAAALCWNWKAKQTIGQLGESGNQVIESPDGRFLGVTGPGSYKALLWDVYKREMHQIANNSAKLAFSPDDRLAAIASPEHFARTWRLPDLTEAHTMRHNAEVWNVDFSPDGLQLVTVAKNNVSRVWNTNTGSEVARMVLREHLWSARFLANSRHIVTHSGDSRLVLWDSQDLREAAIFQHSVAVLGVAFSPDGLYLATHARESLGKLAPLLLDLRTRQVVPSLEAKDGQQINGVEYAYELLEKHKQATRGKSRAANGELIAVAEDKIVKIFRLAAGVEEKSLDGKAPVCELPHEHAVSCMVFSPDCRFLVTASDHDTARVWDVVLGLEVSRLTHENPNIVDVDFSPDGRFIATASWDLTARVWLWKPEDLMREAATRLTRNLSPEEWRKFLPNEPYRLTIPELGEAVEKA